MRKLELSASAAAVALLWAGLADPVLAQARDTAASRDPTLEEVVVTARRVEENIQDVPVAVTAISGEQLQSLVVQNLQDLNKLSPALANGTCTGQRDACTPVIRGQ